MTQHKQQRDALPFPPSRGRHVKDLIFGSAVRKNRIFACSKVSLFVSNHAVGSAKAGGLAHAEMKVDRPLRGRC
jgi:hypothetical protein